jgi:RND family efflux transporter MFP subunit
MRVLVRLLKALLPLAVIVAGVGGFVWLAETRPTLEPTVAVERVWPVEAAAVRLADHQPTLALYGEVVAGRAADARAAVAGEVVEVGPVFRDGALAEAGDLLVAIDPADYESALAESRAQLREAEARLAELRARRDLEAAALERDRDILALAERDMERRRRLADRGTISTQALDTAEQEVLRVRQTVAMRENTLDAEAARIAQQQAAIERLEAQVARAGRDLARSRITAPFTGLVSDTDVELGERVNVGERVAGLIDPARLEARFQLSEAQYGRLLACADGLTGRPVTVLWEVGATRLEFPATVDRIDAEIRMDTGGVAVFATLDGLSTGTALRPGAFVAVRLPGCGYRAVARVPATAVHDGDRVYVVDADDRLSERTVEVAGADGETLLIADGLAEGDRVVTTRFSEIEPGARVEVQ